MDNINEDILDIYETLIDNGVTFFYGSEVVETGEITNFNIIDNETLELELDSFNTYEVSFEDFIENHSKEGANYHTWPDIRKFDKLLDEI